MDEQDFHTYSGWQFFSRKLIMFLHEAMLFDRVTLMILIKAILYLIELDDIRVRCV